MAGSPLPVLATWQFIPPRPVTPSDFMAGPFHAGDEVAVIRRKFKALLGVCSEVTGISLLDLCSNRRTLAVVKSRQIAYWLARSFTLLSYPGIGRRLGDRDHTTVMHGCKRVDAVIAYYGVALVDDPKTMACRLWSLDWSQVRR